MSPLVSTVLSKCGLSVACDNTEQLECFGVALFRFSECVEMGGATY